MKVTKYNRGYNLLEISIAILIVSILITVAWYSYYYFFYQTKVVKAKEQLTDIVKAVNYYYAKEGKFPQKLKEMVGVSLAKEKKNPFGQKIWMDEVYVKTMTPDGRILKEPYRRMTLFLYEKMKKRALLEMRKLAVLIYEFYQRYGYWPKYLGQLGKKYENLLGPWDNPYYIDGDYLKTVTESGEIISFYYKSVDKSLVLQEEFYRKLPFLKSAIEEYKRDNGYYPQSLEDLVVKGKLKKEDLLIGGKKIGYKNGELFLPVSSHLILRERVEEREELKESEFSQEVSDDYISILPKNQIRDIMLDSQKRLWVAIWGGGVGVRDSKAEKWKFYTTRDGLPSNFIYSLAQEGDKIWIGSFEGLSYLNMDNGKIITYTTADGLPDNRITSIRVDFEGKKWCGSWKKGAFVFKNGQVIKKYGLESGVKGPVYQIMIDKYGRKWIGSWEGGLLKVDLVGNTTIFDVNKGFKNNHVISLLERDGQLWVGLWGGGIVVLTLQDSEIWKIYTTETDKTFPSNDVEILAKDYYGNIWAGFGNGKVARLEGEHWVSYQLGDSLFSKWNVTDIVVDFSGNIWIGTWGKGLLKYGDYEE